ncbi:MAG TPA: glutamate-5-semialdehyde dehydrogenase [Candidatus Xenobia bacterium]|jgi:glutamate-5-semialdehyde dehydrogenase
MDTVVQNEVVAKAKSGKKAAPLLATASAGKRTQALRAIATRLRAQAADIVKKNAEDVERARQAGTAASLLDRLTLTPARMEDIAAGADAIAGQPDVLGEGETWTRPNGLEIQRVRVPLGLVGIIYEARPNVTVEAACIAFKAGNAVLLRGSSSALQTNRLLVAAMQEALQEVDLPPTLIQLIESGDRHDVDELVRLNRYLDVIIPRGGADLINRVVQTATVPVIETGIGNCHVYVDKAADLDKATRIVVNAKTHRPSVCNSAEKLLVHQDVADAFLPVIVKALSDKNVKLKGCAETVRRQPHLPVAPDQDWDIEYLDLVMAIKIVNTVEQAVEHINQHGSHHSDAIVTEDYAASRTFTRGVDSAAVYVNASTRFTDGGEFGFGGEMGISTQKLHARGPMGVRELTTNKYVVLGSGQTR